MKEPLTEELLEELLASPDPAKFAKKHRIAAPTLADYLDDLLEEKGLARIDVVRAAGLNETFGYQIFKGQRNPSRDKVLQIAFAMRLDLRETNRLL
ncbi:MAG: helix-turn-helix transcriptional regulator, partial [Slackia sp.]|nr:helix-turn-helix transcriptional regulator [Slackia sp.]